MINLFLKIYNAFEQNRALFEALELPPVEHIDKMRGQPLNPEQFEYYPQPAIFIGWKIAWTKAGKFWNGLLTLEFHVVTDPTWDTSNISTSKAEGLKNVLYHTVVRYVLDDLESENTGKLQRIDEEPLDTGVVNYNVLRYQCSYRDPMSSGEDFEGIIEKLVISGVLKRKI
ncbi:MAG TPA: hypothetical protein VK541_11355 [Pedobacter sp.]|uniref:hypothetical protein n=1 Tax=Pedobacter sp. TaxID=1411316 RepID=UPI002B62B032|nr:hypothetical protein [Pedobacter sp.]HMI03072.1 hypothetical protein [Pedobacter sp.]